LPRRRAASISTKSGGEEATRSLAVVRAGILSAREGRSVEIAQILNGDGKM
jgi:hypothetical protein